MGGLPDFLPDPGVSVTIIKSLFRGQYYNVHVLGFYMFYCDYAFLQGLPDLSQYYIRGGKSAQFITILHGGSAETPKLYYVIYEQSLKVAGFL